MGLGSVLYLLSIAAKRTQRTQIYEVVQCFAFFCFFCCFFFGGGVLVASVYVDGLLNNLMIIKIGSMISIV